MKKLKRWLILAATLIMVFCMLSAAVEASEYGRGNIPSIPIDSYDSFRAATSGNAHIDPSSRLATSLCESPACDRKARNRSGNPLIISLHLNTYCRQYYNTIGVILNTLSVDKGQRL